MNNMDKIIMTLREAWTKVVEEAENGDAEELLQALSVYFKVDADNAKHPTVKSILNGLSEDMKQAAFAYYASTK